MTDIKGEEKAKKMTIDIVKIVADLIRGGMSEEAYKELVTNSARKFESDEEEKKQLAHILELTYSIAKKVIEKEKTSQERAVY